MPPDRRKGREGTVGGEGGGSAAVDVGSIFNGVREDGRVWWNEAVGKRGDEVRIVD